MVTTTNNIRVDSEGNPYLSQMPSAKTVHIVYQDFDINELGSSISSMFSTTERDMVNGVNRLFETSVEWRDLEDKILSFFVPTSSNSFLQIRFSKLGNYYLADIMTRKGATDIQVNKLEDIDTVLAANTLEHNLAFYEEGDEAKGIDKFLRSSFVTNRMNADPTLGMDFTLMSVDHTDYLTTVELHSFPGNYKKRALLFKKNVQEAITLNIPKLTRANALQAVGLDCDLRLDDDAFITPDTIRAFDPYKGVDREYVIYTLARNNNDFKYMAAVKYNGADANAGGEVVPGKPNPPSEGEGGDGTDDGVTLPPVTGGTPQQDMTPFRFTTAATAESVGRRDHSFKINFIATQADELWSVTLNDELLAENGVSLNANTTIQNYDVADGVYIIVEVSGLDAGSDQNFSVVTPRCERVIVESCDSMYNPLTYHNFPRNCSACQLAPWSGATEVYVPTYLEPHITDLRDMFLNGYAINPDVSLWDTSKVTTMKRMFQGAAMFDQDISGWDTSNVENMEAMFNGAMSFNHDLSGWDVSKVTNHDEFSTYTSSWYLPKPPFAKTPSGSYESNSTTRIVPDSVSLLTKKDNMNYVTLRYSVTIDGETWNADGADTIDHAPQIAGYYFFASVGSSGKTSVSLAHPEGERDVEVTLTPVGADGHNIYGVESSGPYTYNTPEQPISFKIKASHAQV